MTDYFVHTSFIIEMEIESKMDGHERKWTVHGRMKVSRPRWLNSTVKIAITVPVFGENNGPVCLKLEFVLRPTTFGWPSR